MVPMHAESRSTATAVYVSPQGDCNDGSYPLEYPESKQCAKAT